MTILVIIFLLTTLSSIIGFFLAKCPVPIHLALDGSTTYSQNILFAASIMPLASMVVLMVHFFSYQYMMKEPEKYASNVRLLVFGNAFALGLFFFGNIIIFLNGKCAP